MKWVNVWGDTRKVSKRNLLEYKKKYSFPQRSIDTCNGLKEKVIMAKCTTTERKTRQI